jgi:hypothetical protein
MRALAPSRLQTLSWPLAPRSREILLVGASLIGYFVTARALVEHGVMTAGGQGGADVFAYWTAGHHLVSGQPLYGVDVGGYGAFLYPPPLAQVFVLLSPLPFPVVVWLWRALELGCIRLILGSWRTVGISLLIWWPLISELDAGNVHLIVGAAVALAIRGDARSLIPSAFSKFASLAAIPAGWRADARGLGTGAAVAAGIFLVSFMLAPNLWYSYVRFLPTATQPESGWFNLGSFVPLWLRFGTAAVLAVLAYRWVRLAAVAATLAFPVLWFHSLSALIAALTPIPERAPDHRPAP